MDLIRLLRSLEEFLYELVGWLVFYPRTLWRIMRWPGQIALYTRAELGKDAERRFADSISPVLMLILSVVLAHVLEMATRGTGPAVATPLGTLLFGSEQGLLLTRSAVFCVLALGAALSTLRRQRLPVNRDTLREPFSIQAFLACPVVLLLAIAQAVGSSGGPAGALAAAGIMALALVWYLWARAAAFRAVQAGGVWSALGWVLISFTLTTALILAFIVLLIL